MAEVPVVAVWTSQDSMHTQAAGTTVISATRNGVTGNITLTVTPKL
jgi:hypothetical protein